VDPVFVKVNARVDASASALVVALSEFPELCVTDSWGVESSSPTVDVWFTYGRTLHEAAEFLVWLPEHMPIFHDHGATLKGRSVRVPDKGKTLVFELSVLPELVDHVASNLCKLSREYNGETYPPVPPPQPALLEAAPKSEIQRVPTRRKR
jgi:hypothetical protein